MAGGDGKQVPLILKGLNRSFENEANELTAPRNSTAAGEGPAVSRSR